VVNFERPGIAAVPTVRAGVIVPMQHLLSEIVPTESSVVDLKHSFGQGFQCPHAGCNGETRSKELTPVDRAKEAAQCREFGCSLPDSGRRIEEGVVWTERPIQSQFLPVADGPINERQTVPRVDERPRNG
jgi:hypothetical protein